MEPITDRQFGTALAASLTVGTILLAIEAFGSSSSLSYQIAEWSTIAQLGLGLGLVGGIRGIWMFGYILNKGARCWGLFILMLVFLNIIGLLLFFYLVHLPQIEETRRQSACSA